MGTKQKPGAFDCYGKAADDEPLFVLRAKDPAAPAAIQAWIVARLACGVSKDGEIERLKEAMQCVHAMSVWHHQNVVMPAWAGIESGDEDD